MLSVCVYACRMGIQHVKGMLLYGPPGTGKTLIARQIGKLLNGKEPKVREAVVGLWGSTRGFTATLCSAPCSCTTQAPTHGTDSRGWALLLTCLRKDGMQQFTIPSHCTTLTWASGCEWPRDFGQVCGSSREEHPRPVPGCGEGPEGAR